MLGEGLSTVGLCLPVEYALQRTVQGSSEYSKERISECEHNI
jgi:hypothetical protein